jgi:hypothetical protein
MRFYGQIRTICTRVQYAAIAVLTTAVLALPVPALGEHVQYAAIAILAAAALLALPASALGEDFGLHGFDVTFTEADGSPATQAGSHPYAMTTFFEANAESNGEKLIPVEAIKDVLITQVTGLGGSPNAVPHCSNLDFLTEEKGPGCSDGSAVGTVLVILRPPEGEEESEGFQPPVFLLDPPPGVAARIGFWVEGVPVTADVGVSESPPYNIVGASTNVSQIVNFFGAKLTLWGNPASPAHDEERGKCRRNGKSCSAGVPEVPFLTLPRACTGPLASSYEADSWQHPGARLANGMPDLSDPNWVTGSALTHDDLGNPRGMSGCGKLAFGPRVTARPSTDRAASPSGLDVSLDVDDEGLTNPEGIAQSDIKDVAVTLPAGVTLNPSLAEGLSACSEADLARETVSSEEGCPEASNVGSVEVKTPLLPDNTLRGALYVATPYENPAHSLIALYLVIKDPGLGVIVKQTGRVEPDPKTGQLISTFEELPQFPLGHVEVHLLAGGRSPLITPPGCDSFETVAELTPWANPSSTYKTTSSFQITHGVGGGPCPPAGPPPFHPGFAAGSIDNSAGSFSPFFMRLTRPDGDQDITRFDATLPPGLAAKLAGVSECSDADIAKARVKSGKEELAQPSCPANSQIGRVEGGAGVGSELTYVPGKLYLAGPTNGAPLSVVGIVPAVAGPFDVGDVVVRQALRVNPRTGAASVDSAASDAIPHILAGIPLAVRDIRVYVDRPNFTINPTGCQISTIAAGIWGGGSDPFSTADDAPTSLFAPFQAASCGSLAFKPKLNLRLKGGTKRGGHPALRNVYKPRPGDSNLSDLVLRLPHSAFLDQAHIRTVCTRVQYAAKACPPGSIYGQAIAYTPLLDQPLSGPVYLRSSDHNLPDLVLSLHGIVDVEAVARIDSKDGGIRASLEDLPDAPLSEAIVEMPSGRKGLIVNSTNLCAAKHHAQVDLSAHNAAQRELKPLVSPSGCGGKASAKRRGRGASR